MDNKGKAEAFHKIFFPPKPAESTVPVDFNYPEPLLSPDTITKDQIIRHIKALSSYKASGPNEIPNILLQEAMELIVDYLDHIYQVIICLGLYVDSWRDFTTVVIWKPGKPDYGIPKAYCPIALLCTMAKLLTSIVAADISNMVE